jgi:hypothetical protein
MIVDKRVWLAAGVLVGGLVDGQESSDAGAGDSESRHDAIC